MREVENIATIDSELLVVNHYTGGANCCYFTTILDLSDQFKLIAKIEGKHSPVELKGIFDSQDFEIKLRDWVYAYHWTSFSASYAPIVILRHYNGKYIPSVEAMKGIALPYDDLDKVIQGINSIKYNGFQYAYCDKLNSVTIDTRKVNDEYYGKLLPVMLDLIYNGQMIKALHVLDKTWPGDSATKQQFIYDLNSVMKESSFYNAIKELNGI